MSDWNEVREYFRIMKQARSTQPFPTIAEGILKLIPLLREWCDLVGAEPGHEYTTLTLHMPTGRDIYIIVEGPDSYSIYPDYKSETRRGEMVSATLSQVVPVLQTLIGT